MKGDVLEDGCRRMNRWGEVGEGSGGWKECRMSRRREVGFI